MDNGPFRMGNSAASARGTGSRSVAPRSEERVTPAVAEEAPRKASVHHAAPTHQHDDSGSRKKKFAIIGGIVAFLIITIIAGVLWMTSRPSGGTAIDSGKYQAVFFTNGQVYFGKLQPFDHDYMKLTNVFYLQTKDATDASKNPQKTADSTSNNVQLIKLGNEIHGPSDEMVISKDQVLFFENLKSDGKVASSIDQYNKSNNK